MKNYWQFDFYVDGRQKTRYFFGTDAAVQKRVKKYKCDRKDLRGMSKSKAEYLREKKTHIIDL